jgi:hypothetical protein
MEWKPIDTAPRDKESRILLSNGASVSVGGWSPAVSIDGDLFRQGWWDIEGGMIPEPTHYMPLPPPPKAET